LLTVKYGSGPDGAGLRVLLDLVVQALVAEPAYSMAGRGPAARSADPTLGAPLAGPGRSPDEAACPPAQPQPEDTQVDTWGLVARAQQGDSEAFGQLYDRYFDTVYRYIYYRVYDRATAEDFTSETFLRALRRIADRIPAGALHTRAVSSKVLADRVLERANRLRADLGCSCLVQTSSDDLGPLPCISACRGAPRGTIAPAPGGPNAPTGGTRGPSSLPASRPLHSQTPSR
jgi:hypothetical protein